MELLLLQKLLTALALGALIGLEREYARYKQRGHYYAGIRTFPLITLFGALSAYFGEVISIWVLISGILLTGSLIVLAYLFARRREIAPVGTTSELAGFLAFFIGMLVYYNQQTLAVMLTVIVAVILYARSMLHHFAHNIKDDELSGALKFAIIVFVVLPFLPNQWYGPYGGIFNPYQTWLMVIFISAISFAGYVLLKHFGERGITLAALLGGLVSSTAVTLAFSEKSNKEKRTAALLAAGVILANGMMFLRILVMVSILQLKLLPLLLLPLLLLIGITVAFSVFLLRGLNGKSRIMLPSPLRLWPVVKFGLLFAAIIAAVKITQAYFASSATYAISFLSGITDVDAITLSLLELGKQGLEWSIVAAGILLAAVANIGFKAGVAYWMGEKKFGKYVLMAFGTLILVGIGLLFFIKS